MWAKLDDKFWANRDVLAVGNEAAGAFARMLSYCADQRTYGDIPADMARFIACEQAVIDRLLERELLTEKGDDYYMPDYCEWNPTEEETEALTRARSRAGKRGAKARWRGGKADSKSHGKRNGNTHGKGTGTGTGNSTPSKRRNGKSPSRSVAGAKVTDEEHALATAIVLAFNEAAGTRYTVNAHLTPLVGRIREHPDLDADEHRRIIAANFAQPWWDDRPGPEVIYGNTRQFERSRERAKAPDLHAVTDRRGSPASRVDADVARLGEWAEQVRREEAATG